MLLIDGRWHLTSCHPSEDGLARVASAAPLCEALPKPLGLAQLQAKDTPLTGTTELSGESFFKQAMHMVGCNDNAAQF